MANAKAIENVKEALRCLPGVGPKTAQRMAFYLLERDRQGAQNIADALQFALDNLGYCTSCNTFSEQPLCKICSSEKRDASLLCVVETPADLEAIEQVGAFSGHYFVLMGALSPLDGIGPEKLAFKKFHQVLQQKLNNGLQEVIIATNLTVEGETTADYLYASMQEYPVTVSRLARGVPVGGELEYMDQGTVAQAFNDRKQV